MFKKSQLEGQISFCEKMGKNVNISSLLSVHETAKRLNKVIRDLSIGLDQKESEIEKVQQSRGTKGDDVKDSNPRNNRFGLFDDENFCDDLVPPECDEKFKIELQKQKELKQKLLKIKVKPRIIDDQVDQKISQTIHKVTDMMKANTFDVKPEFKENAASPESEQKTENCTKTPVIEQKGWECGVCKARNKSLADKVCLICGVSINGPEIPSAKAKVADAAVSSSKTNDAPPAPNIKPGAVKIADAKDSKPGFGGLGSTFTASSSDTKAPLSFGGAVGGLFGAKKSDHGDKSATSLFGGTSSGTMFGAKKPEQKEAESEKKEEKIVEKAPVFSFSAKKDEEPSAETAKPSILSFGSKNDAKPAAPETKSTEDGPEFGFGAKPNANVDNTEAASAGKGSAFGFGVKTDDKPTVAEKPVVKTAPTIGFGLVATKPSETSPNNGDAPKATSGPEKSAFSFSGFKVSESDMKTDEDFTKNDDEMQDSNERANLANPSSTSASPWGKPTTSAFGASATFGSSTPSKSAVSAFGESQSTNNAWGASPSVSAFGNTANSSPFGKPTTAFGSNPSSAFGTQSSAFGAPAATTSVFGNPSTAFGGQSTTPSAFGNQATSQTAFGAQSTTSSLVSGSGWGQKSNPFGGSTQYVF